MPEPRYFSMPSSVVGGAARRKAALNCRPWMRSVTQEPVAWTNSPARSGSTDDGDQLALAAHLDPEHAEAVLGVVVGDPLDQAGQGLALEGREGAPPGVLGRLKNAGRDNSVLTAGQRTGMDLCPTGHRAARQGDAMSVKARASRHEPEVTSPGGATHRGSGHP
jgi:hypothetical protein